PSDTATPGRTRRRPRLRILLPLAAVTAGIVFLIVRCALETSAGPLGEPLQDTAQVWSVAFSRDGKTLARGSVDGTVRLWDFTTPANPRQLIQIQQAHTNWVTSVAFSPLDDTILASGSSDHVVRLWDLTDPAHSRSLEGHTDTVTSVAFSPDGKMLAS